MAQVSVVEDDGGCRIFIPAERRMVEIPSSLPASLAWQVLEVVIRSKFAGLASIRAAIRAAERKRNLELATKYSGRFYLIEVTSRGMERLITVTQLEASGAVRCRIYSAHISGMPAEKAIDLILARLDLIVAANTPR